MPEIRMRRKHQVTLPASIVRAAKIEPDDKLNVTFANGAIVITPKNPAASEVLDVMSFAGIGRGLWGETPDDVTSAMRNLRSE